MPTTYPPYLHHVSHATRILAALWCVLPNVLSTLICVFTAIEFWPVYQQPLWMSAAALQALLALAVILSMAGLAVSVTTFVVHARDSGVQPPSNRHRIFTYANLIAVFTLPATRLLLPMEDPYTGLGSPLASAISILMFGAATLFLFFPVALMLAISCHRRSLASLRSHDIAA